MKITPNYAINSVNNSVSKRNNLNNNRMEQNSTFTSGKHVILRKTAAKQIKNIEKYPLLASLLMGLRMLKKDSDAVDILKGKNLKKTVRYDKDGNVSEITYFDKKNVVKKVTYENEMGFIYETVTKYKNGLRDVEEVYNCIDLAHPSQDRIAKHSYNGDKHVVETYDIRYGNQDDRPYEIEIFDKNGDIRHQVTCYDRYDFSKKLIKNDYADGNKEELEYRGDLLIREYKTLKDGSSLDITYNYVNTIKRNVEKCKIIKADKSYTIDEFDNGQLTLHKEGNDMSSRETRYNKGTVVYAKVENSDKMGNYTSREYGKNGHLTESIERKNGVETHKKYNNEIEYYCKVTQKDGSYEEKIKNKEGEKPVRESICDAEGNEEIFQYDDSGKLVSHTLSGKTKNSIYESYNNGCLIYKKETYKDGSYAEINYDTNGNIITIINYDKDGKVLI